MDETHEDAAAAHRGRRPGDPDRPEAGGPGWAEVTTPEAWEERYTASERIWSGRVNAVLAEIAAGLEPGAALDLGCGEGADVIWLAERGWRAAGVDVSATAVQRRPAG